MLLQCQDPTEVAVCLHSQGEDPSFIQKYSFGNEVARPRLIFGDSTNRLKVSYGYERMFQAAQIATSLWVA